MPRQDSQDAFSRAYKENYARVLAYFKRRASWQFAEDLAAETFIRAWRGWSKAPSAVTNTKDPGNKALPWLYGIARNVLLEHYRANDRDTQLQTALMDNVAEQSRLAVAEQNSDMATAADAAMDLHQALGTLSPSDQELLLLHAWEGLSAKEIASTLGIRPGTARVKLHRARRRLDDELRSPTPSNTHE